ncbi:cytochrome P450 [Lentzea sp. DG1S-22]|uniref:cytochrome P450 n=1 Tax=Lentzea sp. DG1S-22 TaxID=3108822 RepID=UPI002E77FBD8|nr:cytochrome P450 [Lentzea sp. DG1S-22]WVH82115.1 cytochrome P450 [Lentzea sp. DG1S-22]
MADNVPTTDPRCPMHLLTSRFVRDPYPMLRALRETAPAVPVEANGYRMWVITHYQEIKRVLAGRGFYKDLLPRRKELSAQTVLLPGKTARMLHSSRRSVLERDGADHRRMRAVLDPEMSAATIAQYEQEIIATARELTAALPTGEPFDLVTSFARPLVVRTIARIVGLVDDELDEFPTWANLMVTGNSVAQIEESSLKLFRFAEQVVARKRREPGDDLFTRLIRQCDEEGKFDEDELASTFMVLLVGSCEPINAMVHTLLVLLRNPDQLMRLREDRSLLASAVDEGIRLESPFRMLPPRFSDEPFELGDIVIPPREFIVPSPAIANRDPDLFPNPDACDIARRSHGSMSFGHGPHRCLGIELGKLETTVAIAALLDRFEDISLAVSPDQLVWRPGMFMRRADTFPVICR